MEMNANWLAAPIALPLICGGLGLVLSSSEQRFKLPIQRSLAIFAALANLAVTGWLLYVTIGLKQRIVLQVGLWDAPYGITIIADGLSAIMLTLSAFLVAATLFFAIGTLDEREGMNFHPLLLFLLMGVNGAFLAGDLFNLYVFFEVLLMASFVLLTLGGRPAQVHGGIRYVVLNLVASIIFLATAGVIYGTLGTLNLAHIAVRMAGAPDALQMLIAGLLLVTYGSKAGLFPLFFWLPASYHTPHPAVTAIFGGILTKVGVYTLFRIYPLFFPEFLSTWQPFILAVAACTMLAGVLGAMVMPTMRRVLSFHVISHVGFIIMGLGLALAGNKLAVGFGLAAGIFYLIHHMIVKTALLMAGGAAELDMGSGRLAEGYLGGLAQRRPVLAVIFFLAAFSLAGIPPFSGFVSKLGLLQIALDSQQWWVAAVSVVVSLLTLLNMVRLWQYGFTGAPPAAAAAVSPLVNLQRRWMALTPIAMLVAVSLAMGIFSGAFFRWSSIAASQVLDRAGYIQAVSPTDEIIMLEEAH